MLYDLIIIGAGPAGVSSALYAASRGLNTLVLEQSECSGGTLKKVSNITHFTGFPTGESGEVFSKTLDAQLKGSGVEVLQKKVTDSSLLGKEKMVICGGETFKAKTVIIASGETQNIPEFESSSLILEEHLHNFASKYANRYSDVIVIGGSDGAAKEALYLSKQVFHVDMVVIEEELVAVPEFSVPISKAPNIDVHLHSSVVSVTGEREVEEVHIRDNLSNEEKVLKKPGAGIFYYIGSKPNTQPFSELKLDNGYIVADENMRTNIDGIYAVGNIRVKQVRQISTSISDGAIAAIEVSKYLK